MVWWLSAADSAGSGPFYFTAPGVYSVGRKDCTVTIQTDKSISRLHAEISVEAAPPLPAAQKDRNNLPRCKILLKDLSKFGSFVNKDTDPRPVHSLPDKVAILKEGDTITFGILKAVFRLQYVPIILCMPPSTFPTTAEARLKAGAVGAYVLEQWSSQCTHLLVEENSPVTDLVLAATLSRKPVLLVTWLQDFMSLSSPRDQLPSFSRYVPTLKMDSGGLPLPTTIADPLARGETLAGYIVFLQKGYLYRCHDLPSLVNAAGGLVKLFSQEDLKDVVAGSVQQNGILVFSAEQASRKDWFGRKALNSVTHLLPTSEESLVRSILSAKLDLSLASLSPAASEDTDETVAEEDPEMEDDSASSAPHRANVQAAAGLLSSEPPPHSLVDKLKDAIVLDSQPKAVLQPFSSPWRSRPAESSKGSEKTTVKSLNLMDSSIWDRLRSGTEAETVIKGPAKLAEAERPLMALPKTEVAAGLSDEVKAEIIFKSELIVRRDRSGAAAETRSGALPNFKRFRKAAAASGNSFSALIPFAKDPYRESSYRQEMGDYVQQEKKRKEAEFVAEDLFNAERLKRRRVTAVQEARASISGAR